MKDLIKYAGVAGLLLVFLRVPAVLLEYVRVYLPQGILFGVFYLGLHMVIGVLGIAFMWGFVLLARKKKNTFLEIAAYFGIIFVFFRKGYIAANFILGYLGMRMFIIDLLNQHGILWMIGGYSIIFGGALVYSAGSKKDISPVLGAAAGACEFLCGILYLVGVLVPLGILFSLLAGFFEAMVLLRKN